jgi:hypothetical protein
MRQSAHLAWIIFPLWLAGFAGMWVVVTRVLRKMSRMVADLPFDPGSVLRESGWGSASINGVRFRNCVRIVEHRDGWVVRVMPLVGGGKLWLPKEHTDVGELAPRRLLMRRSRVVSSGENELRLFSQLAEFFA